MTELIVCTPRGFTYRRIFDCAWCERRTRHVVVDYLWYGPEVECGGCGHRWSDGYRRRQTNKQRALNRHSFHKRWAAAQTPAAHRAWMHAELDYMGVSA